jgi:hypothetical protein
VTFVTWPHPIDVGDDESENVGVGVVVDDHDVDEDGEDLIMQHSHQS